MANANVVINGKGEEIVPNMSLTMVIGARSRQVSEIHGWAALCPSIYRWLKFDVHLEIKYQ